MTALHSIIRKISTEISKSSAVDVMRSSDRTILIRTANGGYLAAVTIGDTIIDYQTYWFQGNVSMSLSDPNCIERINRLIDKTAEARELYYINNSRTILPHQ